MALPGDMNSTSAPGDPDQKDRGGQVEDARPDDASAQSDQEPSGLPKLFFAAEDLEDQRAADQPDAGQQNGRDPRASQGNPDHTFGTPGPAESGQAGRQEDSDGQTGFESQGSFGQPPRQPLLGQQRRTGGPAQPPTRPGR